MTDREKEIKEVASQLLAGMLANPHLYTMISDEEGRGQQEQILLSNAIMMAENLVDKVKQLHGTHR
jgi:hypothetical protein